LKTSTNSYRSKSRKVEEEEERETDDDDDGHVDESVTREEIVK